MTATTLPKSERFFAPEISKVLWAATLADYKNPTRAELDAAIDLTHEIADLSGWTVSSGTIDTPDMGSRFTSQIGGRTTVDASSITFYADRKGDDVRKVLPRGTGGFAIFMDGGDTAGQPMDVYPADVTSVGKVRSVGDNALQLTIGFAVTSEPAEDVAIPAAG